MKSISEHISRLRNAIKHDTPFTFEGRSYDVADRQQRNDAVQTLLDTCYYDDNTLNALSDILLYEELTDKHPDKMAREDYPIYSDIQMARRKGGVHRKNDGGGYVETSDTLAENVAQDGRNYEYPLRRKRSPRENRYIDEAYISKNKERRLRYREFVRGHLNGPFNVNIKTGENNGKISEIYWK